MGTEITMSTMAFQSGRQTMVKTQQFDSFELSGHAYRLGRLLGELHQAQDGDPPKLMPTRAVASGSRPVDVYRVL